MKKLIGIICLTFFLVTATISSCWSMDFANMSNKELFELRGAIQNAPEPDKTAYLAEWEKRLAGMTEEEIKQFSEPLEAEKKTEDELPEPLTPAQGYEKQGVPGQIIFGGFPANSDSGR